jgi:amidohydrolase
MPEFHMLRSTLLSGAACALLALAPVGARAADTSRALQQKQLPELVEIYKTLHAHPGLSHHEETAAAAVADALRNAGYEVTDHVGVYPDGSRAFGVVGLLKNGPGPTLLIRADMDALPIVEETGLPYASHVLTKSPATGQEVGVMHACGHDIHTTVLIGVARSLAAARSSWHGTLMLIGQPSEETVDGARAMLADHLYERFGRPDMIIGLHDSNGNAAGTTAIAIGEAQAGTTSIDITIRGIGGHGAMPQASRDPIVLAAQYITQIQTIVSREQSPMEPAVVTVGSIHGGSKRNIIPEEVKLQLTTRYFTDHSRQVILDGLRNMAAGLAVSAGLPADRAPSVTVIDNESAPPTYNDPALATRVRAALVKSLGADKVFTSERVMPSEDVGVFGLPGHQIPLAYYSLGAVDGEALAKARAEGHELPGPHNSHFAPTPELTIATGVKSMTDVALTLLGRP